MKKLFVLGLALLCSVSRRRIAAAWNADWTKRVKIGLNTGRDGLPLQAGADAVPLLIRLHTGNFSFVDAKPDGSDLRFIAADDKTPLKFHIEKFDGLNELALIWVQVPKLAPGSSADSIWLYYGNDKAPPASDSRTFYDAGTALVYHFGDAQPVPQDATANANHAASSTAKPGAAGLIGADAVFDGSTQIQVAASPSLKSGANGTTVSFWMKPRPTWATRRCSRSRGRAACASRCRAASWWRSRAACPTPAAAIRRPSAPGSTSRSSPRTG